MPKKKITNIKKLKITSDKILLIIFILLLILVIFLGIKVYNKKQKEKSKIVANLVIPIINIDKERNLSLNVSELVKDDEYILKITNFRADNINQEEISYSITIENYSTAKIEIKKYNNEQNLMIDQSATIIEDLKLKKLDKIDINEIVLKIKETGKVTRSQYRAITGACSFGTNKFCEQHNIQDLEEIELDELRKILIDDYGAKRFWQLIDED